MAIYPDSFRAAIGLDKLSTWLFGWLGILSFGNSRMKSASLARLSRNPMELRSEVEISEEVEVEVVVPGLVAAGSISEYRVPFNCA